MVSCSKLSLLVLIIAVAFPLIMNFKDQRPFNNRTTAEEAIGNTNLDGKIVIVTGANSGIGRHTAQVLAAKGATVVLGCRNMDKAKQAKTEIFQNLILLPMDAGVQNANLNQRLDVMQLDLASLSSIETFAKTFSRKYDSLHILVNNAGVMALPDLQYTADGYERQFGVNHLGHFYLTSLLLPILKQTQGNKRVINVASAAYRFGPNPISEWLKYENLHRYLHNTSEYGQWLNYGLSKSCNILFAKELNRRFSAAPDNIYAFSVHPGSFGSNLQRHMHPILEYLWVNVVCKIPPAKSLSQGSAGSVRCASMDDATLKRSAGHYFEDCNDADAALAAHLLDEENARLLWQFSHKLILQSKKA